MGGISHFNAQEEVESPRASNLKRSAFNHLSKSPIQPNSRDEEVILRDLTSNYCLVNLDDHKAEFDQRFSLY